MRGVGMMPYTDMSESQLREALDTELASFKAFKSKGMHLDMSRGKPAPEQLDVTSPMLSIVATAQDCISDSGIDCRNYGILDGIPEAKELMASLLDDSPETTIVLGNSSLTMMHDTVARCLDFGCLGSTPWAALDEVSFICVVPGYDRHFAILEHFGIKMINVEMGASGPDMDEVERLVASDASIKGMWCVPKYSNPTGNTYSDEVVSRLASMKCAAGDFRIFWDNAYCVHHLYADPANQDQLADIAQACKDAGNPHRYFKFASTSKVAFPGAGICAMASSAENIAEAKRLLSAQMIGSDKLNQLRHVRFLPDKDAVSAHMAKLAEIIEPKFQLVEKKLSEGLAEAGAARWTAPKGGYFVSFNGLKGTAKRTVSLAREAGVSLTSAGATYPYGIDPNDSNIRIAPTMPTQAELASALDVFVCCARIAALESLLR